jgi:hypothetical protein
MVNILYYFIVFQWVDHIYNVRSIIKLKLYFLKMHYFFQASPSTNVALDSKIAHFMKTVVTTAIFHMIDRQTEYIQRVDFK